jgi:glucokinase
VTAQLGLDIGGTKILAALVSDAGQVIKRAVVPTPGAAGCRAVLDAAAGVATQLGGSGPVGVGAAGTIDAASGTVRYATSSLPGWAGTPVAAELAARLRREVLVDNDVNVAALGESWCGAARGARHVLLAAAGTGLGGGLIRDGRVERGARGAAGELAHLPVAGADELTCGCGRTGHLEAIASGHGLSRAYYLRTGLELDGRAVADRAAGGDVVAEEVVAAAGRALGRVLAGLVAVLDPLVVVLAGGAGTTLLPQARAAFIDELLPVHREVAFRPAALGRDAVAVGAARLAMLTTDPAAGDRQRRYEEQL